MTDAPFAEYRAIIGSTDPVLWTAFLADRFPDDYNRAEFRALAEFICGTRDEFPPDFTPRPEDACFVDLMVRATARRRGDAEVAPRPIIEVGPELDFLEQTCVPHSLSPLQLATLAVQHRRAPTKRVAIVLMARDEGIYLPEWLAHHRLIGAEHIFVYTNDNSDGSDKLLHELASAGLITLIINSFARGVNPQRKAYQHSILLLEALRDYKWALYIDADEFVNFRTDDEGTLPGFIERMERQFQDELPGAAVFPWNWRYTDRAFSRSEINVLGYYPHAVIDRLVKPLVNLRETLAMCEVHIPTQSEHGFFVDGDMRRIVGDDVWKGVQSPYAGPVVEHYWSKSFVEFLIKKRRGDHLALEGEQFQRDYFQFFAWTGIPSDTNRVPISAAWIDKVEAEKQEILSHTAIARTYEDVVNRYRALASQAEKDDALGEIYCDLLASTTPSMG